MSVSLMVACVPCSFSSYPGRNKFSYLRVYGGSSPFWSSKLTLSGLHQNPFRQFCSVNGDDIDAHGSSDSTRFSPEHEGSPEKNATGQGVLPKSNEMVKKLRRYGIAGILSYGLLNTAYYLTTFLVVWFYVAPAPGKMGYLAAVERFLKIMAMVWAGSQVTKIVRAGGALALAPVVDRGLSWFTVKFKFESQGKAFMAIVAFCLGLAILLFFLVTLLWA
ncbi:Gag-Pol polyprotein/retrotransposon [Trema orientale]|uniref:Gag-Pol polyprotein/retrotransposon n=1 Tax=Trema orientale TaxID=63057 RepID=A0A2P5EMS0_TREOI|nr:Gag-Pol polyprotein/retrotransposon [Trema orientale]